MSSNKIEVGMRYEVFLFILFIPFSGRAQFGILLNSPEAQPSYTLFENSNATYLIDNCGQIINDWNISFTDNHVKMLPDGSVFYMRSNLIRHVDWEGNDISITRYNLDNVLLEYEVIQLANGNYLCLGREVLGLEDFVELGYDINQPGFPKWMDVVLEIDPSLDSVVWMWNIKDHIIQERDSSLSNFGSIIDNPHKLDMDALQTYDWTNTETFMINGMDYNPSLDLIALSVRKLGEVVIIDHSTTMEEARGSEGGYHDKGGDILFRWGNPENYARGDSSHRYLYFQHNPNWINHGEHEGKIMIFNNRLNSGDFFPYSSVEIIDPSVDAAGHFILPDGETFRINEEPIRYNRNSTGTDFTSGYTSGAKVMPNGNIFVTLGQTNRMFEMNANGELVWDYNIEDSGYIFRSEKYPLDYLQLPPEELEGTGEFVETFRSNYNCSYHTTNTEDILILGLKISLFQNENLDIVLSSDKGSEFSYVLYNLMGHIIGQDSDRAYYLIQAHNLATGYYFFQIMDREGSSVGVQKMFVH